MLGGEVAAVLASHPETKQWKSLVTQATRMPLPSVDPSMGGKGRRALGPAEGPASTWSEGRLELPSCGRSGLTPESSGENGKPDFDVTLFRFLNVGNTQKSPKPSKTQKHEQAGSGPCASISQPLVEAAHTAHPHAYSRLVTGARNRAHAHAAHSTCTLNVHARLLASPPLVSLTPHPGCSLLGVW